MEYRKPYYLKKLVSAALAAIMTATSAFVTVPASAADASKNAELTEWNGTAAVAFAGGTGTEADPYQIATGEQLAYLAQQVNAGTTYEGEYLTLTSDILLNDDLENDQNVWVPIGKLENQTYYDFMGTFDGAYHSISGIYINTTGDAKGLFGCIGKSGTIKNVSVDGQISSGFDYGAGICGRNDRGTISECHSAVDITGINIQFSGGICGYNYGKIYDCTNSGKITYTNDTRICAYIGGICGYSSGGYGLISGCTNTATIDMDDFNHIGGICGYSSYTRIVDCKNTGNITGDENVGGICGYLEQNSIENCHNSGKVYGFTNYTGGICGRTSGDAASITGCGNTGAVNSSTGNTGGISGSSGLAKVSKCYNTADVTSSAGSCVGGICGVSNGTVSECYNEGKIWTMEDNVGGIIGYMNSNGKSGCTVLNCYNTGVIWGANNVGGIFGDTGIDLVMKNCYNTGDVLATGCGYGICINLYDLSNVYYNTDTCTQNDTTTIPNSEKTTKELTCSTVISDLGFDSTVWSKKSNNDGYLYYPDLKCFDNDQPKEVLPAPENVTATAGEGEVSLTWDAVTGASYRVMVWDGSAWKGYDSTSTSYTVKDLTGGKKYAFAVKAYVNGTYSETSEIVYATPIFSLTAPKDVKASAGDSKVQVKWSAVEGAASYRVMVWDGSAWTGYNTTTTSYMVINLTNGKKYAFAVKAYANGVYGETSEIVYATPVASIIPAGVKAGAGDAKVQVKWNAVTGASSYRVMVWDGAKWTGYNTTATSYMVRNLINNKTYAFAVKAYVNGAYGDVSTIVYAIPHNATSIIPTGVKAGAGDSKVQVKWNTVYGASSYRVMVWDGTKWTGYNTTSTSYMVRNLTNGKKYAFAVKAYINGAYSDVSTTVYATPTV